MLLLAILLVTALAVPCFRRVEFAGLGGRWVFQARHSNYPLVYPQGFSRLPTGVPHSVPYLSGTVNTLRIGNCFYSVCYVHP